MTIWPITAVPFGPHFAPNFGSFGLPSQTHAPVSRAKAPEEDPALFDGQDVAQAQGGVQFQRLALQEEAGRHERAR